ncbi:MAG: hypothetical protein LBN27_00065 [Prevotellaceae bacterium]|jgi:hypothetical protein|nr:hypothetical protein [Prevotellaceae bacterium]
MSKEIVSSAANATMALSIAQSLRDILLTTEEQKNAFNEKLKAHIKANTLFFAKDFNIEKPEEFVERLLQNFPH